MTSFYLYMESPYVTLDGVTISYGDNPVLEDVSFTIESGNIYGLIGPNGVGKTTLLKTLTGKVTSFTGELEVFSVDPRKDPQRVRESVGVLPEGGQPESMLRPPELWRYTADQYGIDYDVAEQRAESLCEQLDFSPADDVVADSLSKGQQQKLMIVRTFLPNPDLVLIDEPLVNLDRFSQYRFIRLLKSYTDLGNSVLFSTHNTAIAASISDRVMLLRDGRLIRSLSVDNNVTEETLLEPYIANPEELVNTTPSDSNWGYGEDILESGAVDDGVEGESQTEKEGGEDRSVDEVPVESGGDNK